MAQEAKTAGTRKNYQQLLMDAITEYNRLEENRALRVQTDEIAAIKFLAGRSAEFIKQLKMIWGNHRPQHTAIPMNLLGEKWLQPEEPLPVHGPLIV